MTIKDWYPIFFGPLTVLIGSVVFSLFLFQLLDLDASPVKNITIDDVGGWITVTYYSRNANDALVEKQHNIKLSTNALFYEPRRKGTMVGLSLITVPHPDDFAAWFRVLSDAEAKMKRGLVANMPVHRVLPSAPMPKLALEAACRVCGTAMEPDRPLVACNKCQTPHHKDCWAYIGKCSILHCGETNYSET
jgi:hypothetical protein